jgi:hypothetical protein
MLRRVFQTQIIRVASALQSSEPKIWLSSLVASSSELSAAAVLLATLARGIDGDAIDPSGMATQSLVA